MMGSTHSTMHLSFTPRWVPYGMRAESDDVCDRLVCVGGWYRRDGRNMAGMP